MTYYTLRNLVMRRRRAAMTALAVLLGVSLISGTYIFTDNIHAAFRELFGGVTRGATVIISSRQDLAARASAPVSVLRGHQLRPPRPEITLAAGDRVSLLTGVPDDAPSHPAHGRHAQPAKDGNGNHA